MRQVSNRDAFVNQAAWKAPVLYVTVNGGEVTTDTTEIVIGNLETHGAYRVFIGEDIYEGWTFSGTDVPPTRPAPGSLV